MSTGSRGTGKGRSRSGSDSAHQPDRVGKLLDGLLKKWGVDRGVAQQDALARWSEVVGERIAEVTRARSISDGVLFVEVRSSAWMAELNLMRPDLMARLNAGLERGRVERIVFVLSDGSGSSRRDSTGR